MLADETPDETKVRVGEAACGLGVFAVRAIRKNSLVSVISGRILEDPDYSSDYCIDLGGTLSLEPQPPFRFLNHCCEPNCQLLLVEPNARSRRPAVPVVQVVALRGILPDEELTIDYGWNEESPLRCLCGAPSCRGWVVAQQDDARMEPAGQ